MSINAGDLPDYELADEVVASSPAQIRALGDPLRMRLLDLVGRRAATVTELAATVERPKSSVAHHVKVLLDAGLLQVVRTRKVRAIEERFYGRAARAITVAPGADDPEAADARASAKIRDFTRATSDAVGDPEMRCVMTTFRIPAEEAEEFWRQVADLAHALVERPQNSDVRYGFVAGFYRSDDPSLPPPG